MKTSAKVHKIVGLGLFTAIVFVLQMLGAFIRFGPFSISLVLVPIVVGAAMYGAAGGAWLGFVFGMAVIISGDAAAFLVVNPLGTVITVLAKGIAAGLGAGLVYKLAAKMNRYVAVGASAIVSPILNTGLFVLGCLVFFMPTIATWASAEGYAGNAIQYMIFVMVGLNFLVEMAINVVLCPVILRILRAAGLKN